MAVMRVALLVVVACGVFATVSAGEEETISVVNCVGGFFFPTTFSVSNHHRCALAPKTRLCEVCNTVHQIFSEQQLFEGSGLRSREMCWNIP